MFPGTTKFICDVCGEQFMAPAIEYRTTTLITPQPCPKCGSGHTMPYSFGGQLLHCLFPNYHLYKTIWDYEDKQH